MGADHHAVRVVPICPELPVILADAFEQAEPGATLVVPMAARKTVNLRTNLEKISIKAGHEPWPRLLQNLRASCETDWVEKYPSHVVAKWLGHSPKIAAQHYLMSREHHFDDVVAGGGAADPTVAGAGQAVPESCSADCSALVTQNATQQASALGSEEPHKTTEPAATIQVAAGSSKSAPVTETDPRQDAAHKKPAGAMDGPGGVKAAGCRPKKQPAGAMDGPAGVKLMAGTGTEQTRFRSGNRRVASKCDADCDAFSTDRVEVLARAVVLVAGMRIPEAAREAVLSRVTTELANTSEQRPPKSERAGASTRR